MKTLTYSIVIALCPLFVEAQEYNPFESIGKEGRVLTLSKGKYSEIYSNDSLQRIGSVVMNMNTGTIYEIIERDTLYSEATLEPTVISRWYSQDPLPKAHESPYAGFSNNPIWFLDPDGADTINFMNGIRDAKFSGALNDANQSETFSSFISKFTDHDGDFHGINLEFKAVDGLAADDGTPAIGQARLMYKGEWVLNLTDLPEDASLADFTLLVELNSSYISGISQQTRADKTVTLLHELLLHVNTEATFLYNSIVRDDNGGVTGIDGKKLISEHNTHFRADQDHLNLQNNQAVLYNTSAKEVVNYYKENNSTLGTGIKNPINQAYPNRRGTNIKGEIKYWELLEQVFENDRTPDRKMIQQK